MKIDINLNKMSEEEFINFLMNDVNNYLLNELSPILQKRQDAKKWSAALDIVRANMDFIAYITNMIFPRLHHHNLMQFILLVVHLT